MSIVDLPGKFIRFALHPVMPFRLDLTVWAVRRRSNNVMDLWNDETYYRVLPVGDQAVLIAVTQRETTLNVTVTAEDVSPALKRATTISLKRLLGIQVDLSAFYKFARGHPRLNELAERFRGLVGRWTAEYVLLRGLGRTDIFPGDDVGARNNLQRWLHLRKKLDYERVQHALRKWKDYGGLVFLHLLLKSLDDASYMRPDRLIDESNTGIA